MKRKKNEVVVYAEGGGHKCPALEAELRRAFSEFFDKTSLHDRKPSVIACGSRENAFRDFQIAIGQGRNALLLVDSETPIADSYQLPSEKGFQPWTHLKLKDNWNKPDNARNEDCHLMVQCMESWFIADWDAISKFFGQDFNLRPKPAQAIEKIPKDELFNALEKATKDSKKGKYGKGSHSFKLLALISPSRVSEASPWAKRFIDEIIKRNSVQ